MHKIIGGCSVTGCMNLHPDGPTCPYHLLSPEDQARVDEAEELAHYAVVQYDPHGASWTEYYCFVCSRPTDHRGEHDVDQYLEYMAGVEAHRNAAESRLALDARRERLSPVSDRPIPSPLDMAKRKRQPRRYQSASMKASGVYRTESAR